MSALMKSVQRWFTRAPEGFWVALHHRLPRPNAPGELHAHVARGYKRVRTSKETWRRDRGRGWVNAQEVRWPFAESDWGDVRYVALWTAAEGGRLARVTRIMPADVGVRVAREQRLVFSPGDLEFPVD